jgi:general secretion pathway protein A
MYSNFYGMSAAPFQLTPDSDFFFESTVHAKAMAHLKYGLHQAEGFIVITGEVGAGKTTLVERLCATLDPRDYMIAKISTTQTSADDTLRMIVAGFGIQAENLNKGDLLKRFEAMLIANFQAGRRALLLVDEAQNLSLPALEELRMLSNFLVGNKAPLQSFLLGQPQFRPTLALPQMEQLRQRMLACYHLGPLNEHETRTYIEHRLGVAGWRSDPSISDEAYRRIYQATGGIPRRVNTLCSRVLLFGFLDELHAIDETIVDLVAAELQAENGEALSATPPRQVKGEIPENPSWGQFTRLQSQLSSVDARLSALSSRIGAPLQRRMVNRTA